MFVNAWQRFKLAGAAFQLGLGSEARITQERAAQRRPEVSPGRKPRVASVKNLQPRRGGTVSARQLKPNKPPTSRCVRENGFPLTVQVFKLLLAVISPLAQQLHVRHAFEEAAGGSEFPLE